MVRTTENNRAKTLFSSLLVFFVVFAVGWYVINKYESFLKQQQQGALGRILASKSSSITHALDRRFVLLYGIRAYVVTNFEQFDEAGHSYSPEAVDLFLKEIFTTVPDIRSVSISPAGIHLYIYPVNEITEEALGHNLLTDKRPHVVEKVKQTIESGRIGLSGPYPLRQDGSLGLVSRLPIYQNNQFWGFTVMVLNVPRMLIAGGVEQTSDFSIRVAGGDSFWGDSGVFESNPLIETIPLPDGQWEIALSLDNLGLTSNIKGFLFILNGMFSLLASSLCFFFYTRQYYLHVEVEKATNELRTQGENLRETEDQFRRGIMNAPFPIMIHAEDGEVVRINDTLTELTGYTHSDIPTIYDWTLKANGEKMEAVQEVIDSLFESDTTVHEGEFTIRTKSGEFQVWDFSSAPLGKLKDERRLVISTANDITKRKREEAEREHLIAQLQDKTAEQERFIYTVSHDLKSPLITISGFCDMAKNYIASGDQEQVNNSLDIVSNAAKRMGQLLSELLEISRVGVKINPSEIVSLEGLVKEASVSGVISENNTTLEIEPGLPDVKVDRQYLLQVFENLLVNASRYSRSANGGSHVKIGVTRNEEELICYVKDNGIGIESQYLDKVFGLFEKLDAESDSTGVGLAIVKRIIESHGGRIWAESEGFGHGTTFFFTLPEA